MDYGGNGEQGAEPVQEESPDEDSTISQVAQYPGGMAEGCEGIRA